MFGFPTPTSLRTIARWLACISLFLACAGGGDFRARAQRPTKATEKSTDTAPAKSRRVSAPRHVRRRGTASEESFNFLVLGDHFFETGRWKAADAAYREAQRLGHPEAAAALKELNENTRTQ